MINTIGTKPVKMVKPRLSPELSKNMYGIMQSGFFGEAKTSEVVERGCSWWKGPTTNRIAKVRMRSKGESVIMT